MRGGPARRRTEGRALLFALVVVAIGLGLLAPSSPEQVSVAEVAWCVAVLAILGSAVGVHRAARTPHDPGRAWLAAALLVPPLHDGTRALVAAFSGRQVEHLGPSGAAVVAGAVMAACLFAAGVARTPRVLLDPVALVMAVVPLGLLAGFGTTWIGGSTGFDLDSETAGAPVRLLLGLMLLVLVTKIDQLGLLARGAVAGGMAALVLGAVALDAGWTTVATALLGAGAAAFGLFLWQMASRTGDPADEAEQGAVPSVPVPPVQQSTATETRRVDQWRDHEVRATVAGLAAVTRVLDVYEARLPLAERRRLTEFSRSEMERLARLVEEGRPMPEDDLGRLLTAFVESLRIQGCRVDLDLAPDCGPASLHEVVSPVLRTLTDNVVRHAPGALVTIDVRRDGDLLEVTVSDDGPGLPPGLRDALFGWGSRGRTSPGEGIGLSSARELARRHGGDLRLVDPPPSIRAAFVLTLPVDGVAS